MHTDDTLFKLWAFTPLRSTATKKVTPLHRRGCPVCHGMFPWGVCGRAVNEFVLISRGYPCIFSYTEL